MTFIFKFRQAIIAACILLFGLGAFNVAQLPISLFPKSTKPTVRVTVPHDMDILELKEGLGEKIEHSLLNIEKIERVEATYSKARATFLLQFEWDKSPNLAVNETTAVTSFFQTQLPDYLPPIKVDYIDAGIENYVAVRSDRYTASELSLLVESRLEPVLANFKGLHKSFISKVNREEVRVEVNPYAMIRYGIKFDTLHKVLQQARFNMNLGTIVGNDDRPERDVFYLRSVSSLAELKALIIDKKNNRVIRLKDVAGIKLALSEQDRVYYIDESAVVAVAAWPQPNANLYQFSQQFQQAVSEQLADIGEVVFLNDPLTYINDSLEQVIFAILLSMVFAAFAVLIAFRSLNLTFLIAFVIPCSLLASILLLQWFDVGLNMVSLAAMSVSCGLVIDNAVVVMDAICRKISLLKPTTKDNFTCCVLSSVTETRTAILSASATTLVVFLPLAFTQPVVYALVGELSLVVVSILTFSIAVSLFFLPAMILSYAHISGSWEMFQKTSGESNDWFNQLYSYLMNRLFHFKILQLMLILVFTYLTFFSVELLRNDIRKEIVAEPHPNIIDVELGFASGDYSQAFRESLVKPVRRQVISLVEDKVKHVFTDMRTGLAYLSLHLKDFHDADDIMRQLRQSLKETKHFNINVSPWVSAKLSMPQIPDYRIVVYGLNEEKIRRTHEALVSKIKSLSGTRRVRAYPRSQQHAESQIMPNVSLVKTMGMQVSSDAIRNNAIDVINHALQPRKLYDMRFKQGDVPLLLQVGELHDITSMKNIPLSIDDHIYSLRHLVEIEEKQAWSHYYTRNGQDTFLIEVWFNQAAQKDKSQLLKNLLDNFPQIDIEFLVQDTQDEIWENIQSLVKAQLLALALIIVVLLASNGSFLYTLITLLSIPLGLIGAALALYWFDSTISVNSLVGLLILTGLTINNTILITQKLRYLLNQGQLSLQAAVIEAASSRLRAMFVTTVSTILGMMPIAMALGGNGNIMQPLGISVAAGLLVSLLGSLLLSPVLLYWAHRLSIVRQDQVQLSSV